ncbi:MAG: hypothetical protein QMD71_09270 [bacterium]|nr:hypothetical protein [bacterium]
MGWEDSRIPGNGDIYGRLVKPSGDTLPEIAICKKDNAQESPAIAWDGSNYLIVWSDKRNGNYDIYGRRVSPSDDTLAEIVICTQDSIQKSPAVAWDGDNYLVVWEDKVIHRHKLASLQKGLGLQ